jgi:hypothetical protein
MQGSPGSATQPGKRRYGCLDQNIFALRLTGILTADMHQVRFKYQIYKILPRMVSFTGEASTCFLEMTVD